MFDKEHLFAMGILNNRNESVNQINESNTVNSNSKVEQYKPTNNLSDNVELGKSATPKKRNNFNSNGMNNKPTNKFGLEQYASEKILEVKNCRKPSYSAKIKENDDSFNRHSAPNDTGYYNLSFRSDSNEIFNIETYQNFKLENSNKKKQRFMSRSYDYGSKNFEDSDNNTINISQDYDAQGSCFNDLQDDFFWYNSKMGNDCKAISCMVLCGLLSMDKSQNVYKDKIVMNKLGSEIQEFENQNMTNHDDLDQFILEKPHQDINTCLSNQKTETVPRKRIESISFGFVKEQKDTIKSAKITKDINIIDQVDKIMERRRKKTSQDINKYFSTPIQPTKPTDEVILYGQRKFQYENLKNKNEFVSKNKLVPIVIDARYEQEHTAGHIPGALNICSPRAVKAVFWKSEKYMRRKSFIEGLKCLSGCNISHVVFKEYVKFYKKSGYDDITLENDKKIQYHVLECHKTSPIKLTPKKDEKNFFNQNNDSTALKTFSAKKKRDQFTKNKSCFFKDIIPCRQNDNDDNLFSNNFDSDIPRTFSINGSFNSSPVLALSGLKRQFFSINKLDIDQENDIISDKVCSINLSDNIFKSSSNQEDAGGRQTFPSGQAVTKEFNDFMVKKEPKSVKQAHSKTDKQSFSKYLLDKFGIEPEESSQEKSSDYNNKKNLEKQENNKMSNLFANSDFKSVSHNSREIDNPVNIDYTLLNTKELVEKPFMSFTPNMITNKFFASDTLKKTQSELNLQYKSSISSKSPKKTLNQTLEPNPLNKYFSNNMEYGKSDFNIMNNSNFLDIFDKNYKNSRSQSRKNEKNNNFKPKQFDISGNFGSEDFNSENLKYNKFSMKNSKDMNESGQKRSLNIKNEGYSKQPNESSLVESSILDKKKAKELVKSVLFQKCEICNMKGAKCLCKINPLQIIHCEFSQFRGPRLWKTIRNKDSLDQSKKKKQVLSYPNLFLLDEGYKKFHELFPSVCIPENGYLSGLVKDNSTLSEQETICEKEWKKLKGTSNKGVSSKRRRAN